MLFQYIGDNLAPKKTIIFGHSFNLHGEPVDVTKPDTINKLKGNPSFIEVTCVELPEPEVITEPVAAPEVKASETYDIPVEEDLSDLTEEELEKLTAPKKKKSK